MAATNPKKAPAAPASMRWLVVLMLLLAGCAGPAADGPPSDSGATATQDPTGTQTSSPGGTQTGTPTGTPGGTPSPVNETPPVEPPGLVERPGSIDVAVQEVFALRVPAHNDTGVGVYNITVPARATSGLYASLEFTPLNGDNWGFDVFRLVDGTPVPLHHYDTGLYYYGEKPSNRWEGTIEHGPDLGTFIADVGEQMVLLVHATGSEDVIVHMRFTLNGGIPPTGQAADLSGHVPVAMFAPLYVDSGYRYESYSEYDQNGHNMFWTDGLDVVYEAHELDDQRGTRHGKLTVALRNTVEASGYAKLYFASYGGDVEWTLDVTVMGRSDQVSGSYTQVAGLDAVGEPPQLYRDHEGTGPLRAAFTFDHLQEKAPSIAFQVVSYGASSRDLFGVDVTPKWQ